MLSTLQNSGPRNVDLLGRLCFEGQQIATYLFQVPDDEAERQRLGQIIDSILEQNPGSQNRELPRIARTMKEALSQPPSPMLVDQLVTGFDRIVSLWKLARSGIF